jgi:hypothetical protein
VPGTPLFAAFDNLNTDAEILTFQIVSQGPQITLKFVFASNEFIQNKDLPFVQPPIPPGTIPVSTNVRADDLFGAFLNGAPIPTSLGTTVVTPDAVLNASQFADNDPSASGGVAPLAIRFNGLSAILTATANVIPGQVYTMQLAIADGHSIEFPFGFLQVDNVFDSAVFIQATSVTSPAKIQTAWPTRWIFNPADQTYNGYIDLVNLGPNSIAGQFQVILTFLPRGASLVPIANTEGSWNAATHTFTTNNVINLNPLQSLLIPIKVRNPLHQPLPTFYNLATTILPTFFPHF